MTRFLTYAVAGLLNDILEKTRRQPKTKIEVPDD